MGCCFGKSEKAPDAYQPFVDPEKIKDVTASAIVQSKRIKKGALRNHTEYFLSLGVPGTKDLCCWKRYGDFESLHKSLKLGHPAALAHFGIELPPKHINDTEVRRQQLEQYMRQMVSSSLVLWTKEFNDFLGCDEGIVQQISCSPKKIQELWKEKRKNEASALFRSRGSCDSSDTPLMTEIAVLPGDPVYDQIENMFGGGSFFRTPRLHRISRVENAKLRRSYNDTVTMLAVKATPGYFIPTTPVTNSRSNETLLFSIIKPVDIDLVAKKGFVKADEFFCRKQFGRGIYFTDNALNAHDQSYDCCAPGTVFTLVIAKVALGNPAILMKENTELSGPPQPQRTYATKSGAQTPASYHSVLAESRPYGGSLPWREYVVYNENFAYPEYKVTYTLHASP